MPKQRNKAIRRSKRIKMELKKQKNIKLEEEEDDFEYYPNSNKYARQPIETLYLDEGIKQEIDDDPSEPEYEIIQNYTNELFLVPMSEKQTNNKPNHHVMKEKETKNKTKKPKEPYRYRSKSPKPFGRRKKIYQPPPDLEEEIIPIVKTNSGLKKTEVPCNENFHLVDVFSIFGKSVGDQLRSFPMDKAMSLQNQIQDLITQATEESFKL